MEVLITICDDEVCIDYPDDTQERHLGLSVGELGTLIHYLKEEGYTVPNPHFISTKG